MDSLTVTGSKLSTRVRHRRPLFVADKRAGRPQSPECPCSMRYFKSSGGGMSGI